MSKWYQVLPLVFIACSLAIYFFLNRRPRSRVLPPPRSTKIEPPYQETNSLAKLFVRVVALKERSAMWPAILRELNAHDDPHIRTLLLEIREQSNADPRKALEAIEQACIMSKREEQGQSAAELLELALRALRKEHRK